MGLGALAVAAIRGTTPRRQVLIGTALAFLLVGARLQTTQTAGLALATDIAQQYDAMGAAVHLAARLEHELDERFRDILRLAAEQMHSLPHATQLLALSTKRWSRILMSMRMRLARSSHHSMLLTSMRS